MKNKFSVFFAAILALMWLPNAAWPAEGAVQAKPAKTVRLLTVGNSFSHNATHCLGNLAASAGNLLVHHQAYIGGATMAQHWEKAQQYEKDPRDQRGLYETRRSLKQELLAEHWDFVTIQQASVRSHDLASYRPFATQLHAYIKQHAPQAEVLFHETWAYRRDDPRFAVSSPAAGEPATQEAMYQGLARAYQTIAGELGARLIPVGDAFHLADTDPVWGYKPDTKYDFANARPPALPDQSHSLHLGWQWHKQADGKSALRLDGHHANAAGEYLGACVWYEVLFSESAVDNKFVPAGLDSAYAQFLQQTAHQAVADSQARKSPARRP